MISIDDMVDRQTQALLDAKEDADNAASEARYQRWLRDVYEEAFESAFTWMEDYSDMKYDDGCNRLFKDFMRERGLNSDEQYQLLEWLFKDERFEPYIED